MAGSSVGLPPPVSPPSTEDLAWHADPCSAVWARGDNAVCMICTHGFDTVTRRPSLTVTSYLAPAVQPLYEAIARHLARRLGRRLTFTPAESYDRLVEDVDDIAFVCSVPYVLLTSAGSPTMVPVAAPVLAGERYAARPIYYSDVIASTASSYGSLADLRGATLAYNEVFSQSGFMVVCAHLEALGETERFFGSLYPAGYHQEAIRLVADGRVDGAAIDSQVLAIQLRDVPDLASRIR